MPVRRRLARSFAAALGAGTLAATLAAACSSHEKVHGIEATAGPTHPPGQGAVGSGGLTDAGANANDAGVGTFYGPDGGYELGAVDGGIDPDAGCATGTTTGALVPIDLLLMVDKSGSMADQGKWAAVSTALDAFFTDPASAGLRVALRFFPDSGCDGVSCSTYACAKPLVDLAPLTLASAPADVQEQRLLDAVASRSPGGDTPMYAALGGAETWAIAHAGAQPGEKATVVLVTDGEPNGCDDDIGQIASLAASARIAHGVPTYAVGLAGSNVDQMNQIADAGGTKTAYFIGSGDVGAQLLGALKQIQGQQIACDLAIPAAASSKVDPHAVNVVYVPGDGSAPLTIGEVEGASFCAHGGWYPNDAANPTEVLLCPSTCAAVGTDVGAKVEIVLGCKSLLN
jgi:hypothetical protein